jgi:hypothetical protein
MSARTAGSWLQGALDGGYAALTGTADASLCTKPSNTRGRGRIAIFRRSSTTISNRSPLVQTASVMARADRLRSIRNRTRHSGGSFPVKVTRAWRESRKTGACGPRP